MPSIEINGTKVAYEGKKMILQVANEAGIELPQYCYHPGLSIVASCRICLVEAESPDPKDPTKLVKIPKLIPSCQTPAVDGMKVYSTSPKAAANQQAVMEFLLLNHPLDCPVCDQAGECFLQDYSYKYGKAQSRFEEDKAKNPKKDIGEHVLLYSDRCIMCTRCVRFTREISGTSELAVFGRGHREEIDVFPGRPINNPLSGNVVDLCPVGALLDKDFLFAQRVWFLKSAPSISPFNSGGENIYIHHNEGRIHRLKPRENKDVNGYWLSDESRYCFNFVHENRLGAPQGSAGLSWDAAYGKVKSDLAAAQKGPGSLAAVLSPFDSTEEIFLQIKFIRSLDPQAWLCLTPSHVAGQDQVFTNPVTKATTYVIKAEKAPNRVGAEKMLKHFGGNVCSLSDLPSKKISAAVVSADPFPYNDAALAQALAGLSTLITLTTRKSPLIELSTLALPASSWAEKSGVYENFQGRVQPFVQAIAPVEESRASGRIFWDLLGLTGTYQAAAARGHMATAGLAEYEGIVEPQVRVVVDDMQFAEL